VRSLEKHIEKIARKVAFETVGKQEKDKSQSGVVPASIEINAGNLDKYVGKPKYTQDTIYETSDGSLPVGVVMGLAWNPLGGSPVYIETAAIKTATSEGGQ
jgi:ATP-dependent Lon protease